MGITPILLTLFVLGISQLSQAKPRAAGCAIGLNENLPKKNEPLLLVQKGKTLRLAIPNSSGKYGSIDLKKGEEIVVACPGKNNLLLATDEEATTGKCEKDDIITIGKKQVSTEKLDCKNRVAASLSDTRKPCAGGKGTIVEIGFKVEEWFTLVESCHNKQESLTYYSTHTVYGTSLSGKVIQSYRPGFSRGDKDFYKGFDPNVVYNEKNQEEVIEDLFGSKLAGKYMDRKKSFFLARGHLAPDADFLFGTWQLLTYFYINAAPQWQSINAGHWLAVENHVRKVAINLNVDLDVATGTDGILRLPDGKGVMKEVYLAGKGRLPVPDRYWKVLHNPKDNSCIALVSTNNPFLDEAPETICNDICKESGWPNLQTDNSKGYVYCCSYQDFKKAIKDVPNYKCDSVLSYV